MVIASLALLMALINWIMPQPVYKQYLSDIRKEAGLAWFVALGSNNLTEEGGRFRSQLLEESSSENHWYCSFLDAELAIRISLCSSKWKAIGPNTINHSEIRNDGVGRYSVWNGGLWFSTPDGSDPNVNGKQYLIYIYDPQSLRTFWLFVVAGVLGLSSYKLSGHRPAVPHRLPNKIVALMFAAVIVSVGMASGGVISVASALVVGIHYLPFSRSASLAKGFWIFLFAFLLSVVFINTTTIKLGLRRTDQVNGMIRYLTSIPNDKPLVLLVGASYTKLGIDEDLLADALEKNNHIVRIARLGWGGMSHMERLNTLRWFLENTKTIPSVVMLEICEYYDAAPLRQMEQNLYSTRSVVSMDNPGALQGIKFIWTSPMENLRKLELLRHILEHWAVNVFNIGFFLKYEPLNTAGPYDYRYQDKKKEYLSDEQVRTRILNVVNAISMKQSGDPRASPSLWVQGLVEEEMRLLGDYGVKQFVFYSLPNTDMKEALYARNYCQSMTEYPCIQGSEIGLLNELMHGDDWYDKYHLQRQGTAKYSRWLADQLVATVRLP